MAWRAELKLDYTRESQRSVARYLHQGPLRILQSLYPEGDQICHNVLVHPPGGLVGGDTLDIQVSVAKCAHGLVSTPGATRFYKSGGHPALQQVVAHVSEGARLEWLPLEAIAYNDCEATNRAIFNLEPGAELIVPAKKPKAPITTAEFIGISTGIASLAGLIIALINTTSCPDVS